MIDQKKALRSLAEKLLYPPDRLLTTPLGARLPFNYHRVPERIRLTVQRLVSNKNTIIFHNTLDNHIFEDILGLLKEHQEYLKKLLGLMFFNEKLIVLTHDMDDMSAWTNIETTASIEENFGFRASWNFIAFRYKWDKALLNRLKTKGHEIGLHGFYHDTKLHLRSNTEIERLLDRASVLIEEYEIRGGRMPAWYVDRRVLKVFSQVFSYDTTMQDVSATHSFIPRGCGCVRPYKIEEMLEIPTNINFGLSYVHKRTDIDPAQFWTKKALNIAAANGLSVCMTHPNKAHMYGKQRMHQYKDFLKNLHSLGFKSILPSEIVDLAKKNNNEHI